jgi:AcrR family transcriptional regulator
VSLVLKTSERVDRIVQAAGSLFARQGYHGTSTREIALMASVSENTIFRHFEGKEDIFWASLRSRAEELRFRRDLLQGIANCDPPEVVLPKIIQLLTDVVSYKPELPRLIAVAFLELNGATDAFCQDHLTPPFAAIYEYLVMSMKGGEIRSMDPYMTTAALTSMVLMHPGISKIIRGGKPAPSDSRKAARAYTKFWLNVLSTKQLSSA